MPERGKKYQEAAKLVDRTKLYSPAEGAELAKKTSYVGFNASVEAHLRLGVDPRHADQMVRGTVVLPHGIGKTKKICVLASGEKVKEAEAAGADFAGGDELIEKIAGGWIDFDVVIATPDIMRGVGKLGRILGTKGLMPNPKSGTVTFDIKKAVEETKAGKVEFRVDKTSIIHSTVGKASFDEAKLVDNVRVFLQAVQHARPAAAKGKYIRSMSLSTTMGPSFKIAEDVLEK
jgi:large subunit ribosomal protein L1